jgi:hypothetical protein
MLPAQPKLLALRTTGRTVGAMVCSKLRIL